MKRNIVTPETVNRQKQPLLNFSLILYVVSLILPAYGENLFLPNADLIANFNYGIGVLVFGLALGWMGLFSGIGSLAVYANLFYFFALFRAYKNCKPIISTLLMVGLSLLSFFHREIEWDRGPSFGDYISVWGWGAVLWFFAFGVLAWVVFADRFKPKFLPKLSYIITLFSVLIASLVGFQVYRTQHMSEEAILRLRDPRIALITAPQTIIAFVPPPTQLKSNALVAIEGAFDEKFASFDLGDYVAEPDRFYYDGMVWQKHNLCVDNVCRLFELIPTTQTPDYTYRVTRNTKKDIIDYRLTDRTQILWYSQSKLGELGDYPYYEQDLNHLFDSMGLMTKYDRDNLPEQDLVGQEVHFWQSPTCKLDSLDPTKNRFQINGKLFYVRIENLQDATMWCGKEYNVVIKSHIVMRGYGLENTAIVFDKNTRPIAVFNEINGMVSRGLFDKSIFQLEGEPFTNAMTALANDKYKTLINEVFISSTPYSDESGEIPPPYMVLVTKVGNFYLR